MQETSTYLHVISICLECFDFIFKKCCSEFLEGFKVKLGLEGEEDAEHVAVKQFSNKKQTFINQNCILINKML